MDDEEGFVERRPRQKQKLQKPRTTPSQWSVTNHPLTQLSALNTLMDHFVVSLKGDEATNVLWTLNLSTVPGQQKRLLTILQGSTFFVNYAEPDYPSRVDVTINQIAGTYDSSMQQTHSVATLVPFGPANVVINPGNITGYNVQYKLLGPAKTFEISNIPLLTFGATIGDDRQAAIFPLTQAIVLDLQIARAIY